MGDSTSMSAIPLSVDIAGAYANGHLGVVSQAEFDARFPRPRYTQVRFDVTGADPRAQVRDWENGDKGGSLQQWVIDHNKAAGKKDAVVYCNRETIPEVRQLTGSQILGTDYFLFVTTLDGTLYGPWQYPHVIACQVLGAPLTRANYDLSVVFDGQIWR